MRTILTRKARLAGMTALALSVVALAGCFGGDGQTASMALYVKDDITEDYAEVHVTYTSAQVLPEGAADWVVAFEGERTIELLALSDSSAKEKLADLSVRPGPYQGLRIAVSQVEAIDHNGTPHALVVVGDLLQISESFEVGEEGGLSLLVDFDLDASIDASAGTFAAEAKSLQRSDRDTDGDGIPDIDDPDTDGDGIPDAEDDDMFGDGRGPPEQSRHGYFGLCTAWFASEAGRQHGNATNSSAFQHLQQQADGANQTVDAFCDEQEFPGPPEAVPERAQQAREDAMERREQRGAPDGAGSQGDQTGSPPAGQGNQTGGPGGQGAAGDEADDPDGARDPHA